MSLTLFIALANLRTADTRSRKLAECSAGASESAGPFQGGEQGPFGDQSRPTAGD